MSETLVLLPSVLLGPPSLAPLGASLRRRGLSVTEVDLSGAITPELLPDIEHRRLLHQCSPRLPLEYFTAEIDVPAQWRQVRAGYVCFDGAYEVVADRVATSGWPIRHLPGGHLTVLTDPDEVAGTVLQLADDLCS